MIYVHYLTVVILNIAQCVLWPHTIARGVNNTGLRLPTVVIVFFLYQYNCAVLLNARKAGPPTYFVMFAFVDRTICMQAIDFLSERMENNLNFQTIAK